MIDMESEWQFPFVFSAIDGSHLPIKCPKGGSEAMKQYYNFKNFLNSTYIQSTDLWNKIEAGLVIPDKVQVVSCFR